MSRLHSSIRVSQTDLVTSIDGDSDFAYLSLIVDCISDSLILMQVLPGDAYMVLEVNQSFLTDTGFEKKKVVGRLVSEILSPEGYNFWLTKYHQAIETGETVFFEKESKLPSGDRYFQNQIIPIFTENKCTHLLVVAKNVSELKQSELNLKKANELLDRLLKESEEDYRLIAEASADGIYRTDENGSLTFVNQSYCEMLGHTVDELINSMFTKVLPLELREQSLKQYYVMLEDGISVSGESLLRRCDGSLFPVYFNMLPIRENDITLGFIGVIRDISHQKQLEDAKVQLLSDAAHELRTPLAIMKSNLDLLKLQGDIDSIDFMQMIKNFDCEIGYLSRIIEDISLLAETNYEARNQLRYEGVRVDELLDDVVENLRAVGIERKITVDFIESVKTVVPADFEVLKRLFTNLISNAIRYGKENGWVKVALKQDGDFAEIMVSDNGIGIRKSDIPRIFERFYRVDKARSRAHGGSGLGLSICKWIVEAHGGTIVVNSSFRRGSEFVVRLPLGNN